MSTKPKTVIDNFLSGLTDLLARIPSPFKSYTIPIESFKKQFEGIDYSNFKLVRTKPPQYYLPAVEYMANPIQVIKCIDKNNEPFELVNGPRIESRISYRNKKTVLYFDSIYISNNSIVGMRSRFVPSFTQTIPLDEITKIEVQDGHKRYRYV